MKFYHIFKCHLIDCFQFKIELIQLTFLSSQYKFGNGGVYSCQFDLGKLGNFANIFLLSFRPLFFLIKVSLQATQLKLEVIMLFIQLTPWIIKERLKWSLARNKNIHKKDKIPRLFSRVLSYLPSRLLTV